MSRGVLSFGILVGAFALATPVMAANFVAKCPVLSDSGLSGDVTASRLEVKYRQKIEFATYVDGVDYVHVDRATGAETRETFVGGGRLAGLNVGYCNPNEAEMLESIPMFTFWSECVTSVEGLQKITLLGSLSMREAGQLDFDLIAPDFSFQRRLVQTGPCQ
jgi:hypothetical protein